MSRSSDLPEPLEEKDCWDWDPIQVGADYAGSMAETPCEDRPGNRTRQEVLYKYVYARGGGG